MTTFALPPGELAAVAKWLILAGTLLLIFQQTGIRLNSLWALISTLLAMVAIGCVALWSMLSNLFFQKILRRRKGLKTHGLEKQVFEEKSLLRPGKPSK